VFLPAKYKGRYTGAAKWFYDFFNFHTYWVTGLIKVLFITMAFTCFVGGFISLFISFTQGISLILAGVVLRIVYELIMIMLSIKENTAHIDDTLTRMAGTTAPYPPPSAPQSAPAIPSPQSTPSLCAHCGAPYESGANFCTKCGEPIR